MDMGVDLGSTYTTVSVYRKEKGMPEVLTMGQESPYIPSVVSVKERNGKEKFEFGTGARVNTGKPKVQVFKAFKMLLTESDPQILLKRGYFGTYFPESITRRFLEYVLDGARRQHDEKGRLEHLVIGVPECWFENPDTMDGRGMIRDICRGMEFVDEVELVSEPLAASAFFAHNYQILTGHCYRGELLLIDYGGGTLDITLTEVTVTGEHMEIKIKDRTGAGENEEGKIGKAGILYMESVMEEGLRRAGLLKGGENELGERKFMEAVQILEQKLKSNASVVEDTFEEYHFTGSGEGVLEEIEEEEFDILDYGDDQEVVITYGLLLEVYNRVIRGTLDEKLNVICSPYMEREQERLKIVLVGGFGNFCLVKKQVEERFHFSSTDKRREDIIRDSTDRERAISLGAALLASGKIGIKYTASYSIGLYTEVGGRPVVRYAIHNRQDIQFGMVYGLCTAKGTKMIIWGRELTTFVINGKGVGDEAFKVPVKEEYRRRLVNNWEAVEVGFSINPKEILSIHVREFDLIANQAVGEWNIIALNRFHDMLDLAKKEVVRE